MEPTVYYAVTQRDLDVLVERIKRELRPATTEMPVRLCKLKEAAAQLGLSEKTIRRRVESKRWPHYRDPEGGALLVDVQEIRTLLRVEAEGPTTPTTHKQRSESWA